MKRKYVTPGDKKGTPGLSFSLSHSQTFSLSFYQYEHIPDEHVYIEKRLLRYTERHEEEREGEQS